MKLQKQLIRDHNPAEGRYGDCYRTCIAILLDMDAADVPHFVQRAIENGCTEGKLERIYAREWLALQGYTLINITLAADGNHANMKETISGLTQGMPFIHAGASNKFPGVCHATVGQGYEQVECEPARIRVACDPGTGQPGSIKPWYSGADDCSVFFIELIVRTVAQSKEVTAPLERANLELQRRYNEQKLQENRLDVALARAKEHNQ